MVAFVGEVALLTYERNVLGNMSSEQYWHLVATSAASNVAGAVGSSLGAGIGNFIGAGIGFFFAGPLGAAVVGAIGSTLGTFLGGILANLGVRKLMGGNEVAEKPKKFSNKEKEDKYKDACKILNLTFDSTKR